MGSGLNAKLGAMAGAILMGVMPAIAQDQNVSPVSAEKAKPVYDKSDKDLAKFIAVRLCSTFAFKTGSEIASISKERIESMYEEYRGHKPTNLDILTLFNNHHADMTCSDSAGNRQHFLQFGADLNQVQFVILGLMNKYTVKLNDGENQKIIRYDFNAVTYNPELDQFETIIDYLERRYVSSGRFAGGDLQTVKSLILYLERFRGAKRFKDLPDDLRNEFRKEVNNRD